MAIASSALYTGLGGTTIHSGDAADAEDNTSRDAAIGTEACQIVRGGEGNPQGEAGRTPTTWGGQAPTTTSVNWRPFGGLNSSNNELSEF